MTPAGRILTLGLLLILPLAAQDERPIGGEKENWPPARTIAALRRLADDGFAPQVVISWSGPQGAGAAGFGKLTNGDAVDEHSVFEIGSITKVYGGLLLALAVEEKTVKLDDTLGALLAPDHELPAERAGITLEELASHRSGLPRLPGNLIIRDDSRPYEDYGPGQLIEELVNGSSSAPGSYQYSNYGAGLLGWLLGRAAGVDFGDLLEKKILKPLGLKSTAAEPAANWAARSVPGHNGQVPVPYWRFDALAAAGDLVASAADVQGLVQAALAADETTALGRAFLAMEKPRGSAGGAMKIGLAWHLLERDDLRLVWHNGGTGGFSSFVAFERATGRSLVILSSSNAPDVTGIGLNAFESALPTGLDDLPVPGKRDWKELPEFEGRYRLPASLVIEIRLKGDYLGAQIAGQTWFTLYPAKAKDAFFLTVAGARVRFLRDDEGEIVGLEWMQQGETSQATKMADLPPFLPIPAERLQRFAGRYALGESLVVDVRAEPGRLSVKLGDQDRIDVFPISETRFAYRAIDAAISFVVTEDGKVTSLHLHQNGMTQEAPRLP